MPSRSLDGGWTDGYNPGLPPIFLNRQIAQMANHASAKKRIRSNARRAVVNGARVGRIRTHIKNVELAISSGDKGSAQAALKQAQPELHRGVRAGVLHRSTASRKISRLSSRIKSMN